MSATAILATGALGLAVVAACSSFEAAPDPDTSPGADGGEGGMGPDAAALETSTADTGADAAADADASAPCSDDLPFGNPVQLADLGDVTSVRLTRDGVTAFVSFAVADADEDIDEGPFPKGNLLYAHAVEGPQIDTHPAPVADPLRLVYEHGPADARSVVTGTRAQVGQKFMLGAALPFATGGAQAREPYALGDGSVIYFAHHEGGVRTLRRAALAGSDWNTAAVPGVTSGLGEGHPVVTDDELTIFFSRGAPADIWMATRPAKAAAFSGALFVPGLSGPTEDRPTWLSPDRCTLLFTSNRSGGYRAYRASRR